MFALSIKQPWAWMIAAGHKTIETRTWHVQYRGELLIVSSKGKMTQHAQGVFHNQFPWATSDILYGKALATARLDICRPMTSADEAAACCSIYSGAMAWVLKDIRQIEPFDVHGRLGIYTVDVKHCIRCGMGTEGVVQRIADLFRESRHWVENGKCSLCFDEDGKCFDESGKLKESE